MALGMSAVITAFMLSGQLPASSTMSSSTLSTSSASLLMLSKCLGWRPSKDELVLWLKVRDASRSFECWNRGSSTFFHSSVSFGPFLKWLSGSAGVSAAFHRSLNLARSASRSAAGSPVRMPCS